MSYAGGRHFRVADDSGHQFPMLVMYPTPVAPEPVQLGPYTLDIAVNAPIEHGRHPIVVISHGSGGTHLGYRDLAGHLARSGYIVLMPEHPGNNRNDNQLAEAAENLSNRPRHLTLAIDRVAAHQEFSDSLDSERVAIVGHSMGGYTGLAIAGGQPSTEQGESVSVRTDPRVKALVLMAPATPWLMAEGALAAVKVPILMFTGEHDPHTQPWHAQVVKSGLPEETALTHQVVANAGHFSFMSPFPAAMTGPDFPPGNDPDGFDRIAFQERLAVSVCSFLDQVLLDQVVKEQSS